MAITRNRTREECAALFTEAQRLSRGQLSKREARRRLGMNSNDFNNLLVRHAGTSRWPIAE